MSSLNRTIIGLKVGIHQPANTIAFRLNRTIIGLKGSNWSYSRVGSSWFKSNYYRIERT